MIEQHLQDSQSKWIKVLGGLLFVLVIAFGLNMSLGSVTIPLKSLWGYITGVGTGTESWDMILQNFRLPKALTAILVGSSLVVARPILGPIPKEKEPYNSTAPFDINFATFST